MATKSYTYTGDVPIILNVEGGYSIQVNPGESVEETEFPKGWLEKQSAFEVAAKTTTKKGVSS